MKTAEEEGDFFFCNKSHLDNRSYHAMINGMKSAKRFLHRGVLQGSGLGPVLFSIYTAELAWILRHHGVGYSLKHLRVIHSLIYNK